MRFVIFGTPFQKIIGYLGPRDDRVRGQPHSLVIVILLIVMPECGRRAAVGTLRPRSRSFRPNPHLTDDNGSRFDDEIFSFRVAKEQSGGFQHEGVRDEEIRR